MHSLAKRLSQDKYIKKTLFRERPVLNTTSLIKTFKKFKLIISHYYLFNYSHYFTLYDILLSG